MPDDRARAAALHRWARERIAPRFQLAAHPPRLGIEAEWIPVDAATHLARPIHADAEGRAGTLAMLRAAAAASGWRESRTASGAPLFLDSLGGTVSYEPGGQIEYGSPAGSVAAAVAAVEAAHAALARAADAFDVRLVACGIDPCTPLEQVPLQLDTARYVAMDAYLGARSLEGRRMMRQSAALQVNVDAAHDPCLTWRVLNAAAPVLTAMFANSPVYAGVETGHASYRAHLWRVLDPRRTGLFAGEDPAGEYARFALDAPALLLAGAGPGPPAIGELLLDGRADEAAFEAHLTTLFPEVRPKGWFEVRSIDAQPMARLAVAPVLVAGLVGDVAALHAAAALLGAPDAALLAPAGRLGLRHPRLAALARALTVVALDGFARQLRAGAALAAGGEEILATARASVELLPRGVQQPAADRPAFPAPAGEPSLLTADR